MRFYVSPGYMQGIHYYFFCLGIVSFTSAVLFWGSLYSYLLLAFYAVHSGIAWYISWFLYRRLKEIFVMNSWSYALSHVFLTVCSAGLSVMLWYMFLVQYEALLSSLLIINFFVIFLGVLWYGLIKVRATDWLFNWQDRRDFSRAKNVVMGFRNKNRLKVVDDDFIKGYKWGRSSELDGLFLQAKGHLDSGNEPAFLDTVRLIESTLCDTRVQQIISKMETIKRGVISGDDQRMLRSYQRLLSTYGKKMSDYERLFYSKFPK